MQTSLFCSRVKKYDKRMQNYESYKGESVYEEDYRFYVPQKMQLYKWSKDKHEQKKEVSNSTMQFDEESYTNKKPDVHVPFNILWKPKPIIGTYPTMKFQKNEEQLQENRPKLTEQERLKALASKPKNLFAPAVKLDNIQDEFVRNLIITNMYESDWKKASKYAAATYFEGRTVYPICTELERHPIYYKTDINPTIHNKFRRRSRDWDKEQNRAAVDPMAQFWLNKDLKEDDIFATEKLVTLESKNEINTLIREEKLRVQHDLTTPNYGGFKAKCSYGVQLRKADLPVTHPNISVSEAITARYADDVLEKKKAEWAKLGLS